LDRLRNMGSRLLPGGKKLHKRVAITIPGGVSFGLRVSGSRGQTRLGGEIGSQKNNESFDTVRAQMDRCSRAEEKLFLLDLMASSDPQRAKAWLNGSAGNESQSAYTRRPRDELIGRIGEKLGNPEFVDTHTPEIGLLCGKLQMGGLMNKGLGGERERLDIQESRFWNPDGMQQLKGIADTCRQGFSLAHGANIDEGSHISGSTERYFRSPLQDELTMSDALAREGIHFDETRHTFSNSDRTMEAALRAGASMSVANAQEFGLITPEKAEELSRQGKTSFTPLYISFRGSRLNGQETSPEDFFASARNIVLDGCPQNVRDADALTKQILSRLNNSGNEPVVPIFVGHSMGGMLAHAMGGKHNCASIGFNSLGLGEGVREFINANGGDGNWCELANDVAHAGCHPSFAMQGDIVSDEEGSLIAQMVIKKPYIGQRYIMPNVSGSHGMSAHEDYYGNIFALNTKMREAHQQIGQTPQQPPQQPTNP
jgi:hypothetical protein